MIMTRRHILWTVSSLMLSGTLIALGSAPANASTSTAPNLADIYVAPEFDASAPAYLDDKFGNESPVDVSLGSHREVTSLAVDSAQSAANATNSIQAAATGCGITNAVAPGDGQWHTSVDGCGVIGLSLSAQHSYQWAVNPYSDGAACVQGRGYTPQGNQTGYVMVAFWKQLGGCGYSGGAVIAWGTVASVTKVKVKALQLGIGTIIGFQ